MTDSVTLIHLNAISREELSDIEMELGKLGITPRVQSSTPGPQGATEWALPALVAFVVIRPFAEQFLKELGKAAGQSVVKAIADTIVRLKGRSPAWRTFRNRKSFTNQMPEEERHSPALKISLTLEGVLSKEDPLTIGFVFPASAALAEVHSLEVAISAIPDKVEYEIRLQARYKWLRRGYVTYGYEEGKWRPDEFHTYNVRRMKKECVILEDEDLEEGQASATG